VQPARRCVFNNTSVRQIRYWHVPIATTPEARERQQAFVSFLKANPNVRAQPYSKKLQNVQLFASGMAVTDIQRLLGIQLALEPHDNFEGFCSLPEKKGTIAHTDFFKFLIICLRKRIFGSSCGVIGA